MYAIFRNRLAGDCLRLDRRLSDREQESIRFSYHDGREPELVDGRFYDSEFCSDYRERMFFWAACARLDKLAKRDQSRSELRIRYETGNFSG